MNDSLTNAFAKASLNILDINKLSRVVISGRRRNFQPKFERIDIRPVKIKDELKFQIVESDGRQDFTSNLKPNELDINNILEIGRAHV